MNSHFKIRLRLRTILVTLNLVILLLPIGGIALLRMYENMLIWQTEETLIHQAAFIKTTYKHSLLKNNPSLDFSRYGKATPKQPIDPDYGPWRPQYPILDLAIDPILPPSTGSKIVTQQVDPIAKLIGKELNFLLNETQVSTLSGMIITDSNGIIVSATNSFIGRSIAHQTEVSEALKGFQKHLFRERVIPDNERELQSNILRPISRSTNIKIYVAHPIIVNNRIVGSVLLVRTPEEIMHSLERNFSQLAYFFIGLFFLVVTLSAFIAYSITNPIRILSRQAIKATSGEQVELQPLENPIVIEFEQLSTALVQMVDKQNKRADYIKNFASHVSHEFKTPLTSIEGALELIKDHDEELTIVERKKFLGNIKKDTSRMRALIRQLNELAKADVVHTSNKQSYLLPVLNALANRYVLKFESVSIQTEEKDYLVLIAPEVIEGILNNLFENSLKHQAKNIIMKVEFKSAYVHLLFRDDGIGISKSNAKKIFDPFFTTQRNAGGTGLGLAIVRSLMNAHKGCIELVNADKEIVENGCQFLLQFKPTI